MQQFVDRVQPRHHNAVWCGVCVLEEIKDIAFSAGVEGNWPTIWKNMGGTFPVTTYEQPTLLQPTPAQIAEVNGPRGKVLTEADRLRITALMKEYDEAKGTSHNKRGGKPHVKPKVEKWWKTKKRLAKEAAIEAARIAYENRPRPELNLVL